MPELPEIEIICRGLHPHLISQKIRSVTVHRRHLRYELPYGFEDVIQEKTIKAIQRQAKIIQISLDHEKILLIHLGMSGRLTWSFDALPLQKHDHILFIFDHGVLTYNDTRRFGFMDIINGPDLMSYPYLRDKGLEPLSLDFTGPALLKLCTSRTQAIKQTLMSHSLIAGVGNIYACESLWRASIDPKRPSHSLSFEECVFLVQQIQDTLQMAIEAGGSTLKDFKNAGGEIGYFQLNHQVYGREDAPCTRCQGTIQRFMQAGRSTFYCPTCQR